MYLNVAGGLKITDPAADLAVICALSSSLKDQVVDKTSIYIGEVGLGGEVRNVSNLEQRIREARKMGIKKALLPGNGTAVQEKMSINTAATILELL